MLKWQIFPAIYTTTYSRDLAGFTVKKKITKIFIWVFKGGPYVKSWYGKATILEQSTAMA